MHIPENNTSLNPHNDTVYNGDKNKVLSKEEVLKIKDEYYLSFYCKDDIYVETDYEYSNDYIEIPNKNGNITKYNCSICTYEEIKNDECYHASCKNNYECLSNKCFNEHYVSNDENPIVRCDTYYKRTSFILLRVRGSDIHCGKPYGDSCRSNNECSSKECEYGLCRLRNGGPSDSEGVSVVLDLFCSVIILIILTIVCCCCCCKKYKYKYLQ